MRREAIELLIGSQFCGEPIVTWGPSICSAHRERQEGCPRCFTSLRVRYCLLPPGHVGDCSPDAPKIVLTPMERLERKLAITRADRDAKQRRIEHLGRLLAGERAARARDRSLLGFRIHYRLRGLRFRLRRYVRFVVMRGYVRPRS